MIKAVIFDMDGVLIDSEIAYCAKLDTFFQEKGYPYNDAGIKELIGCSVTMSIEIVEKMTGCMDGVALWDEFYAWLETNPIDFLAIRVPEAIELMDYLKKKQYKIGLCSSTKPNDIAWQMKDAGLYDYFDVIISGEEVACGKPAPDVYLEALKRLGLMPKEAIVVEDSTYGIKAAKAAEVKCVFARSVEGLPIDQHEADHQITNLLEIIPYLEYARAE